MARLRFPGRPGQRFGKFSVKYYQDDAKFPSDPTVSFAFSIHKRLKIFYELFGESEEEEEFDGFSRRDIKRAQAVYAHHSCEEEQHKRAFLGENQRNRLGMRAVVRRSYAQMIKEGLYCSATISRKTDKDTNMATSSVMTPSESAISAAVTSERNMNQTIESPLEKLKIRFDKSGKAAKIIAGRKTISGVPKHKQVKRFMAKRILDRAKRNYDYSSKQEIPKSSLPFETCDTVKKHRKLVRKKHKKNGEKSSKHKKNLQEFKANSSGKSQNKTIDRESSKQLRRRSRNKSMSNSQPEEKIGTSIKKLVNDADSSTNKNVTKKSHKIEPFAKKLLQKAKLRNPQYPTENLGKKLHSKRRAFVLPARSARSSRLIIPRKRLVEDFDCPLSYQECKRPCLLNSDQEKVPVEIPRPALLDQPLIVEGKRPWKPSLKVQSDSGYLGQRWGNRHISELNNEDSLKDRIRQDISKYADTMARKIRTGKIGRPKLNQVMTASANSSISSEDYPKQTDVSSSSQFSPSSDKEDKLNDKVAAKIERILRSQWEGRLRKASNKKGSDEEAAAKQRASTQRQTKNILRKARLQLNKRLLMKLRQPASLRKLNQQFQKEQREVQSSVRLQSFPTVKLEPVELVTQNVQSGHPGTITCAICGQTKHYSVVCRHYGQLSCESCRKFFTSIIQNPRKFKCKGKVPGKCPITIAERISKDSLCKSCWLEVCLQKFILPPDIQVSLQTALKTSISVDKDCGRVGLFSSELRDKNRTIKMESNVLPTENVKTLSELPTNDVEKKKPKHSKSKSKKDKSKHSSKSGEKKSKKKVKHKHSLHKKSKEHSKNKGHSASKTTEDQKCTVSLPRLEIDGLVNDNLLDERQNHFDCLESNQILDKDLKTVESIDIVCQPSSSAVTKDLAADASPSKVSGAEKSKSANATKPENSSKKMEQKGPRIKHVCRRASMVLGFPRATFPSSGSKPLSKQKKPHFSKLGSVKKKTRKKNLEAKSNNGSPSKGDNSEESSTIYFNNSRKIRCKNCPGCLANDCGECIYCLDKKKFGGPNTIKKACIHRKCLNPSYSTKVIKRWNRRDRSSTVKRLNQQSLSSQSGSQQSNGVVRPDNSSTSASNLRRGLQTSGDSPAELTDEFTGKEYLIGKSVSGLTIESEAKNPKDQFAPNVFVPQPVKHKEKEKILPLARPVGGRNDNSSIMANPRSRIPLSTSSSFLSISNKSLLNVDFWEDYDPDQIWTCGRGLISSQPFAVRSVCYLCGSGGLEELIFCVVCCEPFHRFCLEDDDIPLVENVENWCCRRCQYCAVCGQQNNLLICAKCQNSYHSECLGPNYPSKPSKKKKIWICTKCVRCKSCGATSPGSGSGAQWMFDFSLCADCGKLMDKGNYCPICQKCYEDDDYESKMVQCSQCDSWVHAKCDNMTDEMYQILSYMPESVVYTCRRCSPQFPPSWLVAVQTELRAGLLLVLSALLCAKSAKYLVRPKIKEKHKHSIISSFSNNIKQEKFNGTFYEDKNYFLLEDDHLNNLKPNPSQCDTVSNEVAISSTPNPYSEAPENPHNNNNIELGLFSDVPDHITEKEACEIAAPDFMCDSEKIITDKQSEPQETNIAPDSLVSELSKSLDEKTPPRNHVITENSDSLLSSLLNMSPAKKLNSSFSSSNDDICGFSSAGSESFSANSSIEENISSTFISPKKKSPNHKSSKKHKHKNIFSGNQPQDLQSVRRKLEDGLYSTVAEFCEDVVRIIRSGRRNGKKSHSHTVKVMFKKQMEKAFPWFTLNNSSLWSKIDFKNRLLPEATFPPYVDHTYAQYLIEDSSPIVQLSPFRCTMAAPVQNGDEKEPPPQDTRWCVLCNEFGDGDPNGTGRLLYCGQDDWIHLNCAIWSAEVFQEVDGSLQNVHAAVSRGKLMKCERCGLSGATVGCCIRGCPANFHFMCARYEMATFQEDKKVYCVQHQNKVDGKVVTNNNFTVLHSVYVDLESLYPKWVKKTWQKGLNPALVNILAGAVTIECVGNLTELSDTEEALIPVNFQCTRVYWSTKNPRQRVVYTCRIIELKPEFVEDSLTAEHITTIHDEIIEGNRETSTSIETEEISVTTSRTCGKKEMDLKKDEGGAKKNELTNPVTVSLNKSDKDDLPQDNSKPTEHQSAGTVDRKLLLGSPLDSKRESGSEHPEIKHNNHVVSSFQIKSFKKINTSDKYKQKSSKHNSQVQNKTDSYLCDSSFLSEESNCKKPNDLCVVCSAVRHSSSIKCSCEKGETLNKLPKDHRSLNSSAFPCFKNSDDKTNIIANDIVNISTRKLKMNNENILEDCSDILNTILETVISKLNNVQEGNELKSSDNNTVIQKSRQSHNCTDSLEKANHDLKKDSDPSDKQCFEKTLSNSSDADKCNIFTQQTKDILQNSTYFTKLQVPSPYIEFETDLKNAYRTNDNNSEKKCSELKDFIESNNNEKQLTIFKEEKLLEIKNENNSTDLASNDDDDEEEDDEDDEEINKQLSSNGLSGYKNNVLHKNEEKSEFDFTPALMLIQSLKNSDVKLSKHACLKELVEVCCPSEDSALSDSKISILKPTVRKISKKWDIGPRKKYPMRSTRYKAALVEPVINGRKFKLNEERCDLAVTSSVPCNGIITIDGRDGGILQRLRRTPARRSLMHIQKQQTCNLPNVNDSSKTVIWKKRNNFKMEQNEKDESVLSPESEEPSENLALSKEELHFTLSERVICIQASKNGIAEKVVAEDEITTPPNDSDTPPNSNNFLTLQKAAPLSVTASDHSSSLLKLGKENSSENSLLNESSGNLSKLDCTNDLPALITKDMDSRTCSVNFESLSSVDENHEKENNSNNIHEQLEIKPIQQILENKQDNSECTKVEKLESQEHAADSEKCVRHSEDLSSLATSDLCSSKDQQLTLGIVSVHQDTPGSSNQTNRSNNSQTQQPTNSSEPAVTHGDPHNTETHSQNSSSPAPNPSHPLPSSAENINKDHPVTQQGSPGPFKCNKCKRLYRTMESCQRHLAVCNFEVESTSSDEEETTSTSSSSATSSPSSSPSSQSSSEKRKFVSEISDCKRQKLEFNDAVVEQAEPLAASEEPASEPQPVFNQVEVESVPEMEVTTESEVIQDPSTETNSTVPSEPFVPPARSSVLNTKARNRTVSRPILPKPRQQQQESTFYNSNPTPVVNLQSNSFQQQQVLQVPIGTPFVLGGGEYNSPTVTEQVMKPMQLTLLGSISITQGQLASVSLNMPQMLSTIPGYAVLPDMMNSGPMVDTVTVPNIASQCVAAPGLSLIPQWEGQGLNTHLASRSQLSTVNLQTLLSNSAATGIQSSTECNIISENASLMEGTIIHSSPVSQTVLQESILEVNQSSVGMNAGGSIMTDPMAVLNHSSNEVILQYPNVSVTNQQSDFANNVIRSTQQVTSLFQRNSECLTAKPPLNTYSRRRVTMLKRKILPRTEENHTQQVLNRQYIGIKPKNDTADILNRHPASIPAAKAQETIQQQSKCEEMTIQASNNPISSVPVKPSSSKTFSGNSSMDSESDQSPLLILHEKNQLAKKQESNNQPQLLYQISSEDGFFVQTTNPKEAWQAVAERVQDVRAAAKLKYVSCEALNGLNMMGVNHNAVQYILEQMPEAKNCRKYKFKFHEQAVSEDISIPENPTGCARSEIFQNRKEYDMFNFLASRHRVPPEYLSAQDEEEMQHKSSRRATSMDLPMAMRFRHLRETAREAVGVYRSRIHGRGLFCKRNIDAGEMVIEYAGEVIRSVLTDKREKFYESKGIGCYMFRIDDNEVVDATMHGNAARFINHSCEPNCFSRVINIDGKKHIVIFALRRILRGEELTYDYKFPIEEIKIPCTCGSRRCRKYLN